MKNPIGDALVKMYGCCQSMADYITNVLTALVCEEGEKVQMNIFAKRGLYGGFTKNLI